MVGREVWAGVTSRLQSTWIIHGLRWRWRRGTAALVRGHGGRRGSRGSLAHAAQLGRRSALCRWNVRRDLHRVARPEGKGAGRARRRLVESEHPEVRARVALAHRPAPPQPGAHPPSIPREPSIVLTNRARPHPPNRWEKPLPHMFKDPLLSSLIYLKPPSMVHNASTARPARRRDHMTMDGVKVREAYRQRETGQRSGA
jgi:hypothetical protein